MRLETQDRCIINCKIVLLRPSEIEIKWVHINVLTDINFKQINFKIKILNFPRSQDREIMI